MECGSRNAAALQCGSAIACYFFNNHLRCNAVHASVVAARAQFVAIHRAGSAGQIHLDAIFCFLVPAEETGEGMCAAPNGDDPRAHQRCQMHVGGVHAEHHIQLAHQGKLASQTLLAFGRLHVVVFTAKAFNLLAFLCSATKKKDACVFPFAQGLDDLLHLCQRINLGGMLGKGRDAHPSLIVCFLRLAKSRIVELYELLLYWKPQLLQHL